MILDLNVPPAAPMVAVVMLELVIGPSKAEAMVALDMLEFVIGPTKASAVKARTPVRFKSLIVELKFLVVT